MNADGENGAGGGGDAEQSEQAALVMRAVARKVARARAHPTPFFDFVMREEFGDRRKIKATAHQRVIFDFVKAHDRCVLRLPPGFSKTFTMAGLTLWLLGNDPKARGAMISSAREQAEKPLSMVRDYIERPDEFPELRLVFPNLRRSPNPHDAWSQSKITVFRPPGIRDASLVAVGYGGALPGSRLSWILVDDLLDEENTRTPDGRKSVNRWFLSTVLSRRDATGAKIVITNTPWSDDQEAPDLTFALERAGWPTLAMNAEGSIEIANAPAWDSPDIRPSKAPGEVYRLTEHDPDEEETVPLWPEKYSEAILSEIRESYRHAPHLYAQLYRMRSYSRESSRCKPEWIEAAKKAARIEGIHALRPEYRGDWATFTGIDLGVGKAEGNDVSAFFTFAIREDGKRIVLDAEAGRFSGPEIVAKIQDKVLRFGSMARVENNAAQDYIRQFALEADVSLPLRAHTTGRNKVHPEFGVEGLFVEIANGAWLIPCDPAGFVDPTLQKWIEECVFYRPPPAHTGDLLMAAWFAREEARACGFGLTTTRVDYRREDDPIASLLSR